MAFVPVIHKAFVYTEMSVRVRAVTPPSLSRTGFMNLPRSEYTKVFFKTTRVDHYIRPFSFMVTIDRFILYRAFKVFMTLRPQRTGIWRNFYNNALYFYRHQRVIHCWSDRDEIRPGRRVL